jgi:hypothetical protein
MGDGVILEVWTPVYDDTFYQGFQLLFPKIFMISLLLMQCGISGFKLGNDVLFWAVRVAISAGNLASSR